VVYWKCQNMSSLLIKNATLASGQIVNIFIKDGLIYDIGNKSPLCDQKIDAQGQSIIPGVIDPHVHFRVPGAEYKEDWQTGSKAAVAGGVTTVLDMPNNQPAITTQKTLDQKRRLIKNQSYVNYGLYLGATASNLNELKTVSGIAGVKVYLGSTTGDLLVTDYQIVEEILAETNQIIAFHSEDEECIKQFSIFPPRRRAGNFQFSNIAKRHNQLRPEECAEKSTGKIIELVKKTKKRAYICHVSGQKEIELIRQAKDQKLPIYAEASPHYLFLNTQSAIDLGNFAKVNPPIRSEVSQQALQLSLSSGLIDTIGSDHAPHTREEKEVDYAQAPAGVPGVETSLSLMLNLVNQGAITLARLVELMCSTPADIFKISKRGKIEPGYFADLVLVDLKLTYEVKNSKLYSKCGWSPFSGRHLKGVPMAVIVGGRLVYQKGKIFGPPGGCEVF